jgi:hypothetical protein
MCTTTRTLQRVMFQHALSEENCWSPSTKSSKLQPQGHKDLKA